jgi:mannosyltransferase OCH1-like enzyme
MNRVNNIFNNGIKPSVKLFEKKHSKLKFDDFNYDPRVDQPHFNYTNKTYNSEIPLKIFQTWGTKDLPAKMLECVNNLKSANPEFEYYLFDDADCQNFIEEYFDPSVLDAYDKLIPGAFKADLWRYCVLYVNGGIYLDIKYKPFKGFKLIELTESEHFVLDRPSYDGIYNALMVCKPGNLHLMEAIERIVYNVNNKFYGSSTLSPTGPLLLKSIIKNSNNIDLTLTHKSGIEGIINKNKKFILESYNGYRSEQLVYYNQNNTKHYSQLWQERSIYK